MLLAASVDSMSVPRRPPRPDNLGPARGQTGLPPPPSQPLPGPPEGSARRQGSAANGGQRQNRWETETTKGKEQWGKPDGIAFVPCKSWWCMAVVCSPIYCSCMIISNVCKQRQCTSNNMACMSAAHTATRTGRKWLSCCAVTTTHGERNLADFSTDRRHQ